MCRWLMKTDNAVRCGGAMELHFYGERDSQDGLSSNPENLHASRHPPPVPLHGLTDNDAQPLSWLTD